MKIVNIPRFIISMTLIICIISFFTSMLSSKVFSATAIKYDEITVSAGDTLWKIALNIDGDVNKNVHKLKEINNLESSIIYEGQKILIPNYIK